MSPAEIREKIVEEINQLPRERLPELYQIVHDFRLRTNGGEGDAQDIMRFAGCWSDLPADLYEEFTTRLHDRRSRASQERRARVSDVD